MRESHIPPMTQAEFAELLGFDQTMVSKVELERVEKPSKMFCIALAVAEGLPVNVVLKRAGWPPMKAGSIEEDIDETEMDEDEAMLRRSVSRFKSPEAKSRAIAAAIGVLDALAEHENKTESDKAASPSTKTRRPATG